MTTVVSPNVHVFSVDGSSDDADVVVNTLFADSGFAKKHSLNVFNSPNVCRLLVQSINFIYLYLQLCPEADQEVLFCVPTGGLGNIASGMLARSMGLPVKFLAAVNENDTVFQALESGVFKSSPSVHKTLSCAMDINFPYNIERLFYYFTGGNTDMVKRIMNDFENEGLCNLPASVMESNTAVSSVRVLGEGCVSTMQEVWKEHGYLICPHTAVATRAALDLLKRREVAGKEKESIKTSTCQRLAVICTATPAKFAEAAAKAGLTLPPSPIFDGLGSLPEKKLYMDKGQDWCQIMRRAIEKVWD